MVSIKLKTSLTFYKSCFCERQLKLIQGEEEEELYYVASYVICKGVLNY